MTCRHCGAEIHDAGAWSDQSVGPVYVDENDEAFCDGDAGFQVHEP